MVDGVTSQPFSGLALPLPAETLSESTEIIRELRRCYGRLRNQVGQTILRQHAPDERKTDRQDRLL